MNDSLKLLTIRKIISHGTLQTLLLRFPLLANKKRSNASWKYFCSKLKNIYSLADAEITDSIYVL